MVRKNALFKKVLCILISASLISASAILPVDAGSRMTGTYSYTSNEGSNIQGSDSFVIDDSYFTTSSYSLDERLRTLSSQAAMASASRYGEGKDKYEKDPSNNAQNIKSMLKSMGFANVESNQWYSKEKQENSCGVAIGSKRIVQDGKTYTLLAIFPRSAGYKQEWVGNFNVGTGDVHEGFKAARDEALRFAKQYITQHNINGNLKVWIAGHSRGAAISNLIGGFFAGGGIKYFGDSVSITPQDVYCYTFATPKNIKNGAAKDTVLSVAGARGGDYQYDTPGDAYNYTEGGTITITDSTFNGIRNYPFDYDIITYLPPAKWGFANYGQYCKFDGATEDKMKTEMRKLNTYLYNEYVDGGSPLEFHEKTLDVANLTAKDVVGGKSGQKGMVDFIGERINGFAATFPTNQGYVDNGYQETLEAYIALYGMAGPVFSSVDNISAALVQPVVLSYLAYASDKLIAEGKAANENEASAIAIKELLEIILDKRIDITTYKVDNFFADFTKFIADNEGSKLSDQIVEMIGKQVPQEYELVAKVALGSYCPGYDSTHPEKTSIGKIALEFVKACAYGASPDCQRAKDDASYVGKDGAPKVRKDLYAIISVLAITQQNPTFKVINEAIKNGEGTFVEFITAFLKALRMDGEGGVKYATLDEAANGELSEGLLTVEGEVFLVIDGNNLYTDEFKTQLHNHFVNARNHTDKIRVCAMNLLFAHDGGFNTEYNIRSLATFVGNSGRIPPAHYNETFVAWAKASPIAVTDISLSPKSKTLSIGESVSLTAKVQPSDATDRSVTYSSSDEEVAKVSTSGRVTALSEGEAVITAETSNGKWADCTVTVKKKAPSVTPPILYDAVTYTGKTTKIMEAGSTSGGTMYYGLGTETVEPTEWSTVAPTPVEAGEYFVWYKVTGDSKYNDVKATYVGDVTISKSSENVVDVDIEKDTAKVKDAVRGSNTTVPLEVILEGPICRMYDPNRGEHFYTKDLREVKHLESLGWKHEEESDFVVIDASDENAIAVYRLYNPNGGGMHFYTEDASEAKGLVRNGWNYEGISHYVYKKSADKGVAQYRLYNPNSPVGEHNWTTDVDECANLKKLGWIDEGICWRIASNT